MFFGLTSQDFGLSSIVAKGKVRQPAFELQNHMHPNFKQGSFSTCHTISIPVSFHKKRSETDSRQTLNGGLEYIHHWMTGYSPITYPSAMPFCQVQCPCSTQHSQAMSTKAGTPYYVAPQARGVVDIKI